MIEPDDNDLLAAEYVLGTLDMATRIAVAARRQREVQLDAAITRWEARLTPLALSQKSIEPTAGLYEKILTRIGLRSADAARIVELTQRLNRWKQATIVATSVAASLLVWVAVRGPSAQAPQKYVAVLQATATSPAFLMSVDLKTRELRVSAIAADKLDRKSYELWIINDRLGRPRSLGLVDDHGYTVTAATRQYDPEVVKTATYAITLEPEGGSPQGIATGPVVYSGKLLAAVP